MKSAFVCFVIAAVFIYTSAVLADGVTTPAAPTTPAAATTPAPGASTPSASPPPPADDAATEAPPTTDQPPMNPFELGYQVIQGFGKVLTGEQWWRNNYTTLFTG